MLRRVAGGRGRHSSPRGSPLRLSETERFLSNHSKGGGGKRERERLERRAHRQPWRGGGGEAAQGWGGAGKDRRGEGRGEWEALMVGR